MCRENSSFIKTCQEQRVLYAKTHVLYIYDHISLSSP